MAESLAIDGGKKTIRAPLPGWPHFTEEAIRCATVPLRENAPNYWTNRKGKLKGGKAGSHGMEYEEKFAAWEGARFAISSATGTAALHIALGGFRVGPGDEVIVPSYTFIASSMCVLQAGAIPVFADVKPDDHCIDPKAIVKCLTRRTRAIIPVHLYGCVCDMDEIMAIARKRKLIVIEDCAEAHGGTYKGRKVGTIGHAGAFSFCQSKHWTTGGEGGMTVTDDEDAAWTMRSFRDHGYDVAKRMSLLELEQHLPYIHRRLGWNYRMTEMQSCLGIYEVARFEKWNKPRRQRNHRILAGELAGYPGIRNVEYEDKDKECCFFVFPIILDTKKLTCDLDQFVKALGAEGVPCGPVFWPQSYKEDVFRENIGQGEANFPFHSREYTDPKQVARYKTLSLPNAVEYQKNTFITLCHPMLEPKHMKLIAQGIKKVLDAYAK
ncbi:MAG: DegT/DnrJ/EryC1/StrS family aminotransferase [Candidatus Brocadiia bacterium]